MYLLNTNWVNMTDGNSDHTRIKEPTNENYIQENNEALEENGLGQNARENEGNQKPYIITKNFPFIVKGIRHIMLNKSRRDLFIASSQENIQLSKKVNRINNVFTLNCADSSNTSPKL